jgi:hypothetical protein
MVLLGMSIQRSGFLLNSFLHEPIRSIATAACILNNTQIDRQNMVESQSGKV